MLNGENTRKEFNFIFRVMLPSKEQSTSKQWEIVSLIPPTLLLLPWVFCWVSIPLREKGYFVSLKSDCCCLFSTFINPGTLAEMKSGAKCFLSMGPNTLKGANRWSLFIDFKMQIKPSWTVPNLVQPRWSPK